MENVNPAYLVVSLFLTTLLANSAEDKLMIFLLFFVENRLWHFMQIDSLHEILSPVYWEKWEEYFNMFSAENFTQSAKR